jgi:uncharacterized protein (TIGR03435 family)
MTRFLLLVWLAAQPKLEVVSVKPSPPGGPGYESARVDNARLTVANYRLRNMIGAAYRLRREQLIGGPPWIDKATYDITAKADGPADGREMWALMQTVLTERFHLKMHVEKREFAVYELTIAKAGLLPAPRDGNCRGADPLAIPQEPPKGKRMVGPCGTLLMPILPRGGAGLQGGQVRMPMLASRLTDLLGRTVVDKTGYAAPFDVDIEFGFHDPRSGPPPATETGLPLPGVLNKRLGLKLTPAKAMLDVHVIDSIERPAAN